LRIFATWCREFLLFVFFSLPGNYLFKILKKFNLAALFLSLFFLFCPPLKGGVYLKQRVETSLDGKTLQSYHEWFIDQGKFKLRNTAADSFTEYFFSGTVFYVCGKFNADQLKAFQTRALEKGLDHFLDRFVGKLTCQVVPNNFMVRFFMSPVGSIESVDSSDGLKLTLSISDYSLKKLGPSVALHGASCESGERGFKLKKAGLASKNQAVSITTTVRESLCVDKKVEWRKSLWREVMKAVLVQPGGGGMINELRNDYEKLSGFSLGGTIDQTIEIIGKGQRQIKMTIHPLTYTTRNYSKDELKLPDDVLMFYPESYADQDQTKTSGDSAPEPSKKSRDLSIVDFLQSAVFCGLARGFCIQ
jgi:hypothetical protein